jgi:hypothetical protein
MTAFGASRPLRRIPAIVSFLNPQPALSLVGGNRGGRSRQNDVGDEIAWLQHGFALRGGARRQMEVGDWDVAGPRSPMDADDGFKRYKGDVHVRRVGGDAVLAAAEDSHCAVDASDRAAARTRLALVVFARWVNLPSIKRAGPTALPPIQPKT